jgi:hypothetical protein
LNAPLAIGLPNPNKSKLARFFRTDVYYVGRSAWYMDNKYETILIFKKTIKIEKIKKNGRPEKN